MKVQEWQAFYSGVMERLPSRLQSLYVRFDALSNQVVYSRQDLKEFWTRTREHLRRRRFWNIQPLRLAVNFFKELVLTTTFARRVISHSESEYLRLQN